MLKKNSYSLILLSLFIFSSCENQVVDLQSPNIDNIDLKKSKSLVDQFSVNINKTDLIDYINNEKGFSNSSSRLNNDVFVLDRERLFYAYLGLSIKGSGGGGSFEDGLYILKEIYSLTDEIQLNSLSSASDEKIYIVAGGIGAPTALRNNLDGLIQAIEASVYTLSHIKKQQVGGILTVESGSVNATIALLLSVKLGIPLINVDGAGRSVPKLSNLTYAHESYSIAPTILTSAPNTGSDIAVLSPKDADEAEKLIRQTLTQSGFGEMGGLALWAQTGKELKGSSVIQEVYTKATLLGMFTYLAIYDDISYIDLYFKLTHTFIDSFDGKLTDFKVETKGGFDITSINVSLNDGREGSIYALNENLLMKIDDGTIITAPHLLSYMVEVESGAYLPINNGDPKLMKQLIGKNIHIVASYAESRLYDLDDTFLSILKQVFQYAGPVSPPSPIQ